MLVIGRHVLSDRTLDAISVAQDHSSNDGLHLSRDTPHTVQEPLDLVTQLSSRNGPVRLSQSSGKGTREDPNVGKIPAAPLVRAVIVWEGCE
jgi:hypothetical protein